MLTVLKDAQGQLQVACDWWLVDVDGRWEPRGTYVYVNQLEASAGTNIRCLLPYLISEIASLAPWAVGAYWERRDKTGQQLHAYSRQRLVREEVVV